VANLLDDVIEAHGGLTRWGQLETIHAHVAQGGVFWALKGHQEDVDDYFVTVELHEQVVSHQPFGGADLHSRFTPERVGIEKSDHSEVETLESPRGSFDGLGLEAQWTNLQLAYFVGVSMWTYLTKPFAYALPGFQVDEIEPWLGNGEKWRRLRVTWPDKPIGHSKVQTLYVGDDNLLRRHDYEVDIADSAKGAHFMTGYEEVAGIMLPMSHLIVGRDDKDVALPDPVYVSIDLDSVEFAEI